MTSFAYESDDMDARGNFHASLDFDASTEGCPTIVLRSRHFAKVFNETCYMFVNHERYWTDARNECWKMGGEMLSVENENSMNFIRSVLNSPELNWFNEGVWVGARFIKGRWRWTTGNNVEYSNWAPGQPSKLLGMFSVEDCALMRRDDNWYWHDYVCGSLKFHYNYICQFLFSYHGHHQAHSASRFHDNANVITLTIILVTGGISLLILLIVFLIFRKRYNHKKALVLPAVHFENGNYSHTFEPLASPTPHFPNPSGTLYLNPVDFRATYEEIQKPVVITTHLLNASNGHQRSLAATSVWNDEVLGACGGALADSLSTSLVSASEATTLLGQSEESLHSMSGNLTQKVSSVHNDYVDMNGSPSVSSNYHP